MRDEEIDWAVYHALQEGKIRTVRDLEATGYNPSLIEASLSRLEKFHLVGRAGDSVKLLSFQESLLLCQAKNDETCPFIVENGIIRARPERERKP